MTFKFSLTHKGSVNKTKIQQIIGLSKDYNIFMLHNVFFADVMFGGFM